MCPIQVWVYVDVTQLTFGLKILAEKLVPHSTMHSGQYEAVQNLEIHIRENRSFSKFTIQNQISAISINSDDRVFNNSITIMQFSFL